MHHPHMASGGRYPVLRSVALLFMIGTLAVIGYGIYWIWWEWTQAADTTANRFQMTLVILATTFFGCLVTIAIAEMIKLFIDLEHNTRVMANAASSAAPTANADGTPLTAAQRGKWLEGEETAEGSLLRGR